MSYCTQADLIESFGERELIELTNKDSNASTINAEFLAVVMADADAEIDGYLQGRYTLPLSAVPPMLRNLACDIVRYRLYDDRVTDRVQAGYDDALTYLGKVGTGRVSLGIDSQQQAPAISGGPSFSSTARTFTRSSLDDYL